MCSEVVKIVVSDSHRIRLDKYLSEQMEDLTRSKIGKLIEGGKIIVNGKPEKKNYIPSKGDIIEISDDLEREPAEILPEKMDIDIVYEDEYLLVVNKPAGIVTHPAPGNYTGTLVNGLMYHVNNLSTYHEDKFRPGIVHRLDKGTSGLLVIAKDENTHAKLNEMFHNREVEKWYKALVWGRFHENSGEIEKPIARDPKNRKLMRVSGDGRYAKTIWKIEDEYDFLNLLQIRIITGRTHQIRVHLKYINKFIVGDKDYGLKSAISLPEQKRHLYKFVESKITHPALHAYKLEFLHPVTGAFKKFQICLPSDLSILINSLK